MKKDYLVKFSLMGGGSWGRGSSLKEATNNCIDSMSDWCHLGDFRKQEINLGVWAFHKSKLNTTRVQWDDMGMFAVNEKDDTYTKIEDECFLGVINFTMPDSRTAPRASSRKFWSACKDLASKTQPTK